MVCEYKIDEMKKKLTIVFLRACLFGCNSHRELRGEFEKSMNGKTYLTFETECDEIYVDEQKWRFRRGELA